MDRDDSRALERWQPAGPIVEPRHSTILSNRSETDGRTRPIFTWSSRREWTQVVQSPEEEAQWAEIRWVRTECHVRVARRPDLLGGTIELTPRRLLPAGKASGWRELIRRWWAIPAVAAPVALLWLIPAVSGPSANETASVSTPLSEAIEIELGTLPASPDRKPRVPAVEPRSAADRDTPEAADSRDEPEQAPVRQLAEAPAASPPRADRKPVSEEQTTQPWWALPASAPNPAPSTAAAVLRTFETGRLVMWSEDGVEGYALAGPVRMMDNMNCRTIAVWVKGGPQGAARTSEKCLSPAGALVTR